MSLKSAKKKSIKRQSITLRITLFYAIATSILLALIAVSSYGVMVTILHHAEHQFLSDEINILHHIIKKKHDKLAELKQEVAEIPALLDSSVYRYYIRILDDKENVVIETKGAKDILKNAPFFDKNRFLEKSYWWKSPQGPEYLIMQSLEDRPFMIQIALDTSYQHNLIDEYNKNYC